MAMRACVLCLCILGLVLTGCGRWEAMVPPSAGVGYQIDHWAVVFEFDPLQYQYAVRESDGEVFPVSSLEIDRVAVAGEFNDWSPTLWTLRADGDCVWRLTKPLTGYQEQRCYQFKFLINGEYWVEPPLEAWNTVLNTCGPAATRGNLELLAF